MAVRLPLFGEPSAKKRRPEVPRFAAPDTISAGEYERRLKAGLLEPAPGLLVTAAPPHLPAIGQPSAAVVAPLLAPPPNAGPVAPTPRASDHTGSEDACAASAGPEPIDDDAVGELTDGGPKVGKKHAGVYGFESGTLQARGASRKAIALRLEPLKQGLPDFERVLSEDRQSVTIGTKRGTCDLVIVDEAVSKKHCVLALIGIHGELALSVVDYSTNGTFVNGSRLPTKGKRFRIRSGDRLQVKDVTLEEDFGWTCDFGNTIAFFTRS